jgi:hypothetical protein
LKKIAIVELAMMSGEERSEERRPRRGEERRGEERRAPPQDSCRKLFISSNNHILPIQQLQY